MIFYKDIIEVRVNGKNLLKAKLAKFLFKLQCKTFDSLVKLDQNKKIIVDVFICKINSLKITSIKNDSVIININLDSPYKLSLAYILQIWSLINNSLIVHGGIYRDKNSDFILTGEGGVGKTHKIISSCLQNKQPFMGDDLTLLSGIYAYPIVRPLCIYPVHKNIQNLENIFKNKLKERNNIVLKIKRKVLSYLASLFPKLEFIFLKSYENEYSSVSWAYISPKRLGLNVYLGSVNISGFIALVKEENNIKVSSNKRDIVKGTLYEFNFYEKELNFLSQTFHNKPFDEYIYEKVDFVIENKSL